MPFLTVFEENIQYIKMYCTRKIILCKIAFITVFEEKKIDNQNVPFKKSDS